MISLQARTGGDFLIGRSLCPRLIEAGFTGLRMSPRMVYVDQSRPRLVEGFTRRTFTVMVDGVGERALAESLVDEAACATGDPRPRSRTRRSATRFFKSVAWKA